MYKDEQVVEVGPRPAPGKGILMIFPNLSKAMVVPPPSTLQDSLAGASIVLHDVRRELYLTSVPTRRRPPLIHSMMMVVAVVQLQQHVQPS